MDIAMPVTTDLYDEEVALFEDNYKEISILELKVFKLNTRKIYSQNENQHIQQEIRQASLDIVKILARTRMQNCMEKIKNNGNSSRAVDVSLRLSLDLIEKEIKYCQKIQNSE